MHAKFALHSTIIIWLIFTALSLLLFIPLKHGMNIELQSSAFIGILLYCAVTLFRFIEYALGTYILGQSEFFSKAGLILETIFMVFWIVLYAIGNLIPANIYIIYGLIATQNLIKIIVSIIYYKNDKWLEKSE